MRKIEYQGFVSHITEKDWQSLLRRFNVTKAELDQDMRCFVIRMPCILCEKHRKSEEEECDRCPLKVFEKSNKLGCLRLINSVIRSKNFCMSESWIAWFIEDDKTARHQIAQIHKSLKALPKEKR